MILLDTNILICSKQPAHPSHTAVTQKIIQFVDDGNDLVVCPQSLYELYVVAKRPAANNGLGISGDDALEILKDLQETHSFINDPDTLFSSWHQLMIDYSIMGKTAHDARLVAFMRAHGIENIYTLNDKDFNRYSDIITVLI